MTEPRLSSRYLAALDGLRALAIIAVIFHEGIPRDGSGGPIGHLYFLLAQSGWVGVQLFFVLSGFLITGILRDAKERPHFFRNFYVRRALRIFPPYYFVLLVALLMGPVFLSTASDGVQRILHGQAWLWTYTSNVAMLLHNGWMFSSGWLSLDHTWSLAVEEQFYLAWPLLVFLLSRRGLGAVAWGTAVGAPLWRWAMLKRGASPEVVYSFTLCRLDALAMGSLLALFARSGAGASRQLAVAKGLIVGGLTALAPVIVVTHGLDPEEPAVQTIGFTALGVLCAGLVFGSVLGSGPFVRVLASRPATFVGRYSYGMYLYAGLLAPAYKAIPVERISVWMGIAAAHFFLFVFRFSCSTAIAFLSWHGFERRFLAYKEHFSR